MDLRVLEYFLAVADEENISHAANRIFCIFKLIPRSNFLSCGLLFCMHPPTLERADLLQYTFSPASSRR